MKTIAMVLGIFVVAGCNGHASNTGREPDEYLGCGTDENWRTFADLEPTATISDALAPLITAPAASATVPLAQPVHLTWQQDANDVGAPTGDVACAPTASVPRPGALSPLHEPPISGNVYDLQFTVDGSVVWRVITTLQEWDPPPALWSSWKGKTVSLRIWRMDVLRNDVKEGPFIATQPFTFSVGN